MRPFFFSKKSATFTHHIVKKNNMRKFLGSIIITFSLAGALQAKISADNARLLIQLDSMVKNRAKYRAEKGLRIDAVRAELQQATTARERFAIYSRLYDIYAAFQTDSALRCIAEKIALLPVLADDSCYYDVEFNRIDMMIIIGMFREAFDILERIPAAKLSGEMKTRYLHCRHVLYGYMAGLAATGSEKDACLEKADRYRDSLLAVYPPGGTDYLIAKADRLNAHGQSREAVRLLKDAADTCADTGQQRFLAYALSASYRHEGDADSRMRYLILSAMADLRYAAKEYVSLRELAALLREENDIDRAYEYMRCSMEDAAFYNARSRTVEIAEIFPLINRAYQLKSERRQRIIYVLLCAVSILIIHLLFTIIYIYRQIRELAAARKAVSDTNEQLQELNRTLVETNIIKEQYIARYISRCSAYIDKMDAYRKNLAKLASRSKLEELFRAIKSESLVDTERAEFYREFDETFLGIFPGFVESFNALLNENDRLLPGKNGQLNAELRIYALIRLGITDSARIAEFLRYSVTTIYNYRSKMRNKAAGDKNEFESKVMMIK
jgi:hypothetical protein